MKLKTLLDKETLDYLCENRSAKLGEDTRFLDVFKSLLSAERDVNSIKSEMQCFYGQNQLPEQAYLREAIHEDFVKTAGQNLFPFSMCLFFRFDPDLREEFTKELYAHSTNLADINLPTRGLKQKNFLLGTYYSMCLPEHHAYLRSARRD